jgi:hypothetical protein
MVVGMTQVGIQRCRVVVRRQEESMTVWVVSPPGVRGVVGSDADQLCLQLYLSASSEPGSC